MRPVDMTKEGCRLFDDNGRDVGPNSRKFNNVLCTLARRPNDSCTYDKSPPKIHDK